jgi:hypothetical protein
MSMRVLWAIGISLVVGGNAVVPVAQTLERPAFEVTSVKPNKSGGPRQELSVCHPATASP